MKRPHALLSVYNAIRKFVASILGVLADDAGGRTVVDLLELYAYAVRYTLVHRNKFALPAVNDVERISFDEVLNVFATCRAPLLTIRPDFLRVSPIARWNSLFAKTARQVGKSGCSVRVSIPKDPELTARHSHSTMQVRHLFRRWD